MLKDEKGNTAMVTISKRIVTDRQHTGIHNAAAINATATAVGRSAIRNREPGDGNRCSRLDYEDVIRIGAGDSETARTRP
jgi:hypothetical protein